MLKLKMIIAGETWRKFDETKKTKTKHKVPQVAITSFKMERSRGVPKEQDNLCGGVC